MWINVFSGKKSTGLTVLSLPHREIFIHLLFLHLNIYHKAHLSMPAVKQKPKKTKTIFYFFTLRKSYVYKERRTHIDVQVNRLTSSLLNYYFLTVCFKGGGAFLWHSYIDLCWSTCHFVKTQVTHCIHPISSTILFPKKVHSSVFYLFWYLQAALSASDRTEINALYQLTMFLTKKDWQVWFWVDFIINKNIHIWKLIRPLFPLSIIQPISFRNVINLV